jgi:RNA polymerase sigma-70 factor (ECF subfamily)
MAERVLVSSPWEVDSIENREEILIREFIATGDSHLFEELITPHLPLIRRLLYSIFNGNRADMEDAEQEILVGILRDVKRFKFKSRFKTFLYRYARNKAIDVLRKRIRIKKREVSGGTDPYIGRDRTPEEQYLREEQKQGVLRALLSLGEEEREIVLMKDVEDLSVEEISGMTGLKEGTIKSRLSRTREKLYGLLERSWV